MAASIVNRGLLTLISLSSVIGRSFGVFTNTSSQKSLKNIQKQMPTLFQTTPNSTSGRTNSSWPYHQHRLFPWSHNPPSNESWMNTWLYGYEMCSSAMGQGAKKHIDDAFDATWILTSRKGVYKSIDWSAAAAIEYLGPPANDINFRDHIQTLFNKAADMIWTPAPWSEPSYIHVRCDDPQEQCDCLADTYSDLDPSAYVLQHDPDDEHPMINFCPSFFKKRAFLQGSMLGQDSAYPFNSSPSAYDNAGRVFLQQLFHLDHFMDNDKTNHVQDLAIDYQSGSGQRIKEFAHGVGNVKILARLQYSDSRPPFPRVGYYTSRNAENLAWFAMVRWIQDETGVYPHLPQVVPAPDGPPYPVYYPPMYLTFQNESDPKFTFANNISTKANKLNCSTDTDDWNWEDLLISINGMADDQMYPPEYLASKSKWMKTAFWTPVPTSTAPPSPSPTSSSSSSSTLPAPATKTLPAGMPKDMCGVWYEEFADRFEIWGKDEFWDQQKLGPYGQGLLNNLRGCGAVSSWYWVRTPQDPNYDWVSRGYLPIGQKNCVGHAVVGAGGPDPDGCSGPG